MLKGLSNQYLLSVFLCLTSINTAFAAPMLGEWHNPEIYIAGGAVFSRLNNNKYVNINDVIVNRYSSSSQTTWRGLWGGGAAFYFGPIMYPSLSASLGVAAYTISFNDVRGVEYPFVNDEYPVVDGGTYDTLNYRFHVRSTAVFAEGRLFYTDYAWQPYFLVGLGASWNRLSDYQETPSDPSLTAAPVGPQFASLTNTAFAFEFGLGIQRQLFVDLRHQISYSAALDYRYLNFGKGKLGHFPAQTANDYLKIETISTQGVVVTLKASFC